MPGKKFNFEDKRSGKIIYLGNCLLNQNIRFPGIGICGGAIYDLVEPLMKCGIGIEQLPCMERLSWGGVHRKPIYRMLPMLFKYRGSKFFPIIKLFGKVWLWNYKQVCKKEAKKVVRQMEDYQNSGYEISGIIAMNDSPTCGVTKTGDLFGSISEGQMDGLKLEDLEYPRLEKMSGLFKKVLVEGQGTFIHEIVEEMKRKKINTKIIGFDPWCDVKGETERIMSLLFPK